MDKLKILIPMIVILAVIYFVTKQIDSSNDSLSDKNNRLPGFNMMGIGVGISLGFMLDNLVLGIVIGIGMGLAFGESSKKE